MADMIESVMGTMKWAHWLYEGRSDPWVAYVSFSYPSVIVGPSEAGRPPLGLVDRATRFTNPQKSKPVLYFRARGEAVVTLRDTENVDIDAM